jgi:hypothetical protein
VKRAGCCTRCDREIYEVRDTFAEGPLAGHPRRLGPMLDHGCQVTFQLADGALADVACCVDCANALTPADYQAIWDRVVERVALSSRLARQSDNQRRATITAYRRRYPVAVVGRRCESEPGVLALDRRGA